MEPLGMDNNTVLVFRAATRSTLSNLLNPVKLLPNEKGVPRDWHGLAENCGLSGEVIRSLATDPDPTSQVLKLWSDTWRGDATISQLLTYLADLDRLDVVDDVRPLIEEDVRCFQASLGNGKTVAAFDLDLDRHILTRDDVFRMQEGLEPQLYDAFVLFDDDDIAFATEIIDNMEKNFDMKFCIKERDLVAGGSEHDAVIKLIAERCARLIVVISPAFLESNANKFFYSVAQSISIEQRQRKIIPCIYKDCGKLPPELDCYFKLDFRRSGALWNFWEKLRDSIIVPEKARRKLLSLPENRFSAQSPVNSISRSASACEQSLASSGLKTVSFGSASLSHLPEAPTPAAPDPANTNGFLENSPRKNSLLQRIKSSFTSKSRANAVAPKGGTDAIEISDSAKPLKKKISFRLQKKKKAVRADTG